MKHFLRKVIPKSRASAELYIKRIAVSALIILTYSLATYGVAYAGTDPMVRLVKMIGRAVTFVRWTGVMLALAALMFGGVAAGFADDQRSAFKKVEQAMVILLMIVLGVELINFLIGVIAG